MEKTQKAVGFVFWWTIWARKEGLEIKEKVLAGARNVQIQNWKAAEREFQIAEGETNEARIATFYHPNWKAAVNGVSVEIRPSDDGAILIPLSNQFSSVHLAFQEPLTVKISQWISGFMWLFMLLLAALLVQTKIPLKNFLISLRLIAKT